MKKITTRELAFYTAGIWTAALTSLAFRLFA